MKLFGGLLKSSREIIIVTLLQYVILILLVLLFGKNKTIFLGTIILNIFEIIYIIYAIKRNKKINLTGNNNYFPYFMLGIAIATIFNSIILKYTNIDVTTRSTSIGVIISSCIIGPIFEEFLFRYSFINKLNKFFNNTFCIIISSTLFAILHNNLLMIIFAFIIGITNAYIYIRKRDITIPIIIHISSNLMGELFFSYNNIIFLLGILILIISLILIRKESI